MKKAANLASKIEALKTEYARAKALEKQQADRAAKRTVTRAAHASGLLALVLSGTFSVEALQREFAAVTERVAGNETKVGNPAYEAVKSDLHPSGDAESNSSEFTPFEGR